MFKPLVVLVLCLCGVVGCSKSPVEKAAAHKAKAAAFLKDGKVDEAVLELRNALQSVPNDSGALVSLGEVLSRKGQLSEAFQSYRKAAELDPKNLDAQVNLGELYALGNQLDEARTCAALVVSGAPNRADAHMLLAKIHLRERKGEEAIREIRRAIELEPGNADNRLALASVLLSSRRLEEARKAVDEVLSKDATNAGGLLLLAQIAELQKNPKGAEDAFARLLRAKPDDPGAWMNYGNFWASRRDEKKALDAYRKAGEVDKKGTAGWEKLAEIYLSKPDLASAKQVVGEIRSRDAKSTAATYYEGRVALAEGKVNDAATKFDEVLKHYPNRADVHYFLGVTRYGQHNAQRAKAELQKAVELQPGFLKARMLLAQTHVDLREFDLALKQTDEVSKAGRVPGELVVLRATALLGLGKTAEGRGLLEKLVVQMPGSARAWQRLGMAYLAETKPQKALEAFTKASEADPKDLGSLAMAARILASQKKFDEALARVEAQMKRAGESAGARELAGQLSLAKGDAERARTEFERAIEIDPNAVDAYLALASLHRGPDAVRKALEDADKAIAKRPDYLQAWMVKATLHDRAGQVEPANQAYRKAIEIKSDFVPALNNLAWNLAEQGGNLDEALKFAERAVELAPKAAGVNDTLGWIYVKKGVYLKALAQLELAVEELGKNPAVLYHLGAAYAGKGDARKAVEALEKALAIAKDFPGSGEARKLLDKAKADARKKT